MMNEPAKPTAQHRPEGMASLKNWGEPLDWRDKQAHTNSAVDCGWGRLLFGQTFDEPEALAELLQQEEKGRRDIALYRS